MRTIVVDDEPWMLKRFNIECKGLPDVQLLGSFGNPLKALEYAKHNSVELAFLDVEMPELNGLELAKKLREINSDIIIIFISAYDQYMTEAFKTQTADYYIMKPYNTEDLEAAVERARLLSGRLRKALSARTFGVFELLSDNKPIVFQDRKAKELLALLIDRRDRIISEKEIIDILWAELPTDEGKTNFQRTLKSLNKTLSALRLEDIIEKTEAGVFIHTKDIDCDFYQFLDGNPKAARQYHGEYMLGYDWAENNRAEIYQQSKQLGLFNDAQARNTLCANILTVDDPERTIAYMNDNFLSLVGYTRKEIKDLFKDSFRAMVNREDFDGAKAKVEDLFKQGKAAEVQYRLSGKNDEEVWVICKSEPPKTTDDIREISSLLIDISETKAEQHDLEKAAHCDSLTGLFNRGFAQERIRKYLAATNYTPSGALILVDVDNFKEVNDTYGHPFADTVLTDIAAIFTRAFRSSDIVCRFGGDEMMIFLKGIDCELVAREKLQSASNALSKRLSVKTQHGEISCSFGGTMCPQDGCDFETLYSNADRALYAAKENKNCIVWFQDIINAAV